MTVERALRLMAGVMVLITAALIYFVSINWIWFLVFIGLNLFQSAFTNWCPAMAIFRAMGLKDAVCNKDAVKQHAR